jgi:lactoylglutathione lyase
VIKRLLHTRMRVSDLEETVRFYTETLGLQVVSRHQSPRGSRLAFLKVPGSMEEIELCSFPASGSVQVQEDLVHLAFEVEDLDQTIAELSAKGVPITDRYEVELIELPKKTS